MDAKARKALVDALELAKNFDASYTAQNRRWMVGKLIEVFEGSGSSDSDIKSKTTDTFTRSKALAGKHRDFKLGFKLSQNKEAACRHARRNAGFIPFPAPSRSQGDHFVFQKKGAGLEAHTREMADLYAHPFFRFDPGAASDMWMQRPKVDVGATYTSFLTTSGAM